ncbi:histone deacetylase family protein [Sphingomonas sp.]|uniref:histone deacetylase family protein n=1 Tax=Sphingomonas sp. TaxID=28214 RepID=UPI003D6D7E69
MRTIYSPDQLLHDPLGEINRGALVPPYECPRRATGVIDAVRAAKCGPIDDAAAFPRAAILRIHPEHYVDFLTRAHGEWAAAGRAGDAIPLASPIRGFRSDRIPASLDGRLSYYSFDISTPITAGTWTAVRRTADVALTGAQMIADGHDRAVFSLCRPPGHHAGIDFFGGYCFINNAAIAAQYLRDAGAARVAILDIDYHHGNGTQQIFYDRADVLYVSIHADPATDFPYFLGYADERGQGAGEGFNHNLPLPQGIGWRAYSAALDAAIATVRTFGADALIVSLGLDGFERDSLSHFRLQAEDYVRIGAALGRIGLPTVLLFEGGYAIDDIGALVVNVLRGFES